MAAQIIGAPRQAFMEDTGDIFQNASKIFIKQEMAAIELCGIEAKQRYRISVPQGDTEGNVFLYITEESNCCERICCSVNRSLKLLVHKGHDKNGEVIQTMEKPFSCGGPCPCLRPAFTVNAVSGQGQMEIGTVDDPCHICTMDQKVKNAKGDEVFTTSGSICQAGMCCPCCASVNFDVKKGDNPVGKVEKLPLDCGDIFLKTNRFTVDFGSVTDPTERRLLLGAAMLLDLEYFEQQK